MGLAVYLSPKGWELEKNNLAISDQSRVARPESSKGVGQPKSHAIRRLTACHTSTDTGLSMTKLFSLQGLTRPSCDHE